MRVCGYQLTHMCSSPGDIIQNGGHFFLQPQGKQFNEIQPRVRPRPRYQTSHQSFFLIHLIGPFKPGQVIVLSV